MIKKVMFPLIILFIVSCAQLNHYAKQAEVYSSSEGVDLGLSEADVAKGLKEALDKGCKTAVNKGGVVDGFYKNPKLFIPFPEEATEVKEYALKAGMKNQVNSFEESMNRAAEKATTSASDILLKAVLEMSIEDAWGILKGDDNAATNYLKKKTYTSLYNQFLPISKNAIEEVEVTKYWNPLASAYNATTFFSGKEKVNPNLDKYITEKALDGLFLLIADEELLIRKDPLSRTTEILKKVFEQQ